MSYNYRSAETLYDSLGNSYEASTYYVKTADNTWTAHVLVDGNSVGTGNVTFNSDGSLSSATGLTGLSFNPTSGAASPQTFDVSLAETTQYSTENKLYSHNHNGMTSGKLNSVSIDNNGNIMASYNNGVSRIEGQIAVARFQSPEGLFQSENMSWLPSTNSGSAVVSQDNSQNAFLTNAVEYSNVDLTEELVNLIGAQQHFQANAQVQQTYNQVMQTVENL